MWTNGRMDERMDGQNERRTTIVDRLLFNWIKFQSILLGKTRQTKQDIDDHIVHPVVYKSLDIYF